MSRVSKIPVSLPTSKADNEMLRGLLSRISEGITSFDTRATIATEVSKIITQKLIGRGF